MSLVELARIAGAIGALLSVLSSSCLSTGCIMPQGIQELAGIKATAPAITAKKTWGGFFVEVGTNFTGEAEYETTPEGIKVKVKVDSQAGDVTKAQGERAQMLEGLREIERARIIEQQNAMNQMWGTIIGQMTSALAGALVPKPVAPVP